MKKPYQFYKKSDFEREINLSWNVHDNNEHEYRTPFWRDYARLLHSPAFRRLKGKTQLFPGIESDFFRCRLTHSLEVAEIGKSIAIKFNYYLQKSYKKYALQYDGNNLIDLDLVTLACLGHDIGHPPFGHQGEEALDEFMKNFGGFEGNAQTLRIVGVLEKKDYLSKDDMFDYSGIDEIGNDCRKGLNLCYRSLASVIKYNHSFKDRIDFERVFKGYYTEEDHLVNSIWQNVLGKKYQDIDMPLKTIECQIMDVADDIAYSVYDLEDSFKGGFINPIDFIISTNTHKIYAEVSKEIIARGKKDKKGHFEACTTHKIFNILEGLFFNEKLKTEMLIGEMNDKTLNLISVESLAFIKSLTSNSYLRSAFCSSLVTKYINSVELEVNESHPMLSKVKLNPEIELEIEVLKRLTYYYQIESPKLKIVEYNGKNVVKGLFETLNNQNGFQFLPDDVFIIVEKLLKNKKNDKIPRVICDFIAGMTNSFAIEFYNRLFSTSGISIHKPIN